MPGENYLVDLESAVIDLTVHYKLTQDVSVYWITSAITYGGGVLDSTIEGFHESFGFSTFGRPAVSRNDFNLIYDLNAAQSAFFEAPTHGGLTDPIVGVRYSGMRISERWRVGLEAAAKLPLGAGDCCCPLADSITAFRAPFKVTQIDMACMPISGSFTTPVQVSRCSRRRKSCLRSFSAMNIA